MKIDKLPSQAVKYRTCNTKVVVSLEAIKSIQAGKSMKKFLVKV